MCHTELEIQWDFDSIPIDAQLCYAMMGNPRFIIDSLWTP